MMQNNYGGIIQLFYRFFMIFSLFNSMQACCSKKNIANQVAGTHRSSLRVQEHNVVPNQTSLSLSRIIEQGQSADHQSIIRLEKKIEFLDIPLSVRRNIFTFLGAVSYSLYPIQQAVNCLNVEDLMLFAKCGAGINETKNHTPLFMAVKQIVDTQQPEIIVKGLAIAEILLKCGAIVNQRNRYGDTPLHAAVNVCSQHDRNFGNIQILHRLLVLQPNLNIKNGFGETPLDIARSQAMCRYAYPKARQASYQIAARLEGLGAESSVVLEPQPSYQTMQNDYDRNFYYDE